MLKLNYPKRNSLVSYGLIEMENMHALVYLANLFLLAFSGFNQYYGFVDTSLCMNGLCYFKGMIRD